MNVRSHLLSEYLDSMKGTPDLYFLSELLSVQVDMMDIDPYISFL